MDFLPEKILLFYKFRQFPEKYKCGINSNYNKHCISELFDNYMQQDAHEFLNYLLNTISETLLEEKKAEREKAATKVCS